MKTQQKWLRILAGLTLLLAFAAPASAESVTSNVYDQDEAPAVVGTIHVKVTAGDSQLSVKAANLTSEHVVPDSYTFTIQMKGEPAPVGTKEFKAVSAALDEISCTFSNLKNKTAYSVMVTGYKEGKIVGTGTGSGTPASSTAAMKGLKATAGNGQVKITFDKMTAKPAPANYRIEWWYADKKGKKVTGKTVVIKASQVTKNTYSCDFKKLTNGTTYHFTVSAEDANKQKLTVTADLKAVPNAKKK